jgi:hypothetical protein
MRVALVGAVLLSATLLTPTAGAAAQAAGDDRELFFRLFPWPTGQRGVEDLVRARALIGDSQVIDQLLDAALDPLSTDAAERAAILSDPEVIRALACIDRALQQPRSFPPMPFENSWIARNEGFDLELLTWPITVGQADLFARGDYSAAFAQTRLLHRIAGCLPVDSTAYLAQRRLLRLGAARSLAPHVGRLSPTRCRETLRMVRRRPDWREEILVALDERHRAQVAALHDFADDLRSGDSPHWSDAVRLAGGEREALALLPEVLRVFGRAYVDWTRQVAHPGTPVHGVQPLLRLGSRTPAEKMAASLAISPGYPEGLWEIEDIARAETRERLLACAAALRLYHFQQNRLPERLTALNLGVLARCPFTGRPFEYEPDGEVVALRGTAPYFQSEGPALLTIHLRPTPALFVVQVIPKE